MTYEQMLKSKLKGMGIKVLDSCFNLLKGSGIGKIPGVPYLFSSISKIVNQIIEVDGQKFYISGEHGFGGALELYKTGRVEPCVTQLFCSLVKEGMTVIDVGASIGYYTLLAAKRIGDSGLVFAFEPLPSSYEILLKNISMNNWKTVRAFPLAISDKVGEMTLNTPKIGKNGSTFANIENVQDKIKVKTMPLDSLPGVETADIAKIDVEGAEVSVIRGMRRILAKGRVKVICEVHPKMIGSLGYKTEEIVSILKQHNYNIHLLSKRGLIFKNTLSNNPAHYLFSKESHHEKSEHWLW